MNRPGEPVGRIGILGGSFDPPHFGHLAIAKAARESLELDEVLLLPNNRNPLKDRERRASPEQRMAMLKLLAQKEPGVAVSDIEMTRGGLSYAVETLSELQMVQPSNYWFIMGTDALKDFDKWKAPHRLLKMCRIAVINRDSKKPYSYPSALPAEYESCIDLIPMVVSPISSSEIKDRILQKKDLSAFMPESVINYIRANKLYEL